MKNKKLQVWFPFFFSLSMVVGMFMGYKLRDKMPWSGGLLQTPMSGQLQEVLDLVRNRYVDAVNTDSLREAAIDELLSGLDPHSIYIPAKALREVNEDLAGKFEGIGVEFNLFDDTVHIVTVLKDGPSDKAGLKSGDRIVSVEGKAIAGKKIESDGVRSLLKGPNGSKVTVKLLRDSTLKTVSITRGYIPLYALDAAYMLDAQTGFIRLNKFSETTYEEFMAALEKLQQQGMKHLVLDLRENGGGILSEAVEMADEFLSGDKLIVYTEGKHNPKREYRCRRRGLFETGKLILLMNEGSASASEVLAGALQDWDRATIIGRRSFGKGLVQEQYTLTDGAALRLTVARYFTPLGRSIQKPYDQGNDLYHKEINQRFQDQGILADTVATKSTAFVTPDGKKVYGGGGIQPDISVAFDTTRVDSTIADLYQKNTLGRFVYRYYVGHPALFSRYREPGDFINQFTVSEELYQTFIRFAKQDSVDIRQLPVADRKFLEDRIKTLFARQLWRNDGYFKVSNALDPMILRAREEISRAASLTRK